MGKIAYVVRIDEPTAVAFKTMLEGRGYTVQLVSIPVVMATDFTQFDLIIIADDTGSLNEWPRSVGGASPEADHIRSAVKPVLGLGEGGYAYFGKLGANIGWPNGWHGPLDRVIPTNTAIGYWNLPNSFGAAPPNPFGIYTGTVNEVGIYLPAAPAALVTGLEPDAKEHAPLIVEGRQLCNQLWGFSGGPAVMTAAGQDLFENAVVFGLSSQCPPLEYYPEDCITMIKSADPPEGTAVSVGAVIRYKLQYNVKDLNACRLARAGSEDKIPDGTLFVPGSATDGVTPGADGVLRWDLGPLAPGAAGQKEFRVEVGDAICAGPADGRQSVAAWSPPQTSSPATSSPIRWTARRWCPTAPSRPMPKTRSRSIPIPSLPAR